MYVVAAEYKVQEGKEKEVIDILKKMIPLSRNDFLKWQAGRIRCVEIQCNGDWQFDQLFEVVAYAATSDRSRSTGASVGVRPR